MIHIDRESRAAAMKHVIAEGKRMLAQGTWVIMFPEGTRIARGERGTYQTAGTRLAVESGAPVVPIAVSSGKCWPREGFVKHPGTVTVSIGPAIASAGREPKELMREVEAWIEAEMQRIDPEAYAHA
jgi:1-acyl-sn-glycerol-3-phosphate acyltransferase